MATSRRKRDDTSAAPAVCRIGCVSFLNAKPLIEGLELRSDASIKFDVPSHLLDDLETAEVDIALCPVIDYQRSRHALEIVPVGGIGCDGPTLTVRLFSKVPLDRVTLVHADSDSHTSVALLQVLLHEMHGIKPAIIDFNAREQVAGHRIAINPQTILLIGDKVVTDPLTALSYNYQMDLGEAWHELTGLPFVFATWMTQRGRDLGEIPGVLKRQREINQTRIDTIVERCAGDHGWPREIARRYLGSMLCYELGERQRSAINLFYDLCFKLAVIPERRDVIMQS